MFARRKKNVEKMQLNIKESGEFKYIDEGKGEVLLLLHGLFGALSNWESVVEEFQKNYRVVIPMMPIYESGLDQANLDGLLNFVSRFTTHHSLKDLTLVGNSLGGHVALMYALRNPQNLKKMVLTGSSGLFENAMGGSYPKRGNYEFVKEKVAYTFYDPKVATETLVNEVFETTKSLNKCMRMISFAKSAQRNNLGKELHKIQTPTLLIWGLNDTITPPLVAHEFEHYLPSANLKFIDKCGHAPMMEHPKVFNQYLYEFLAK